MHKSTTTTTTPRNPRHDDAAERAVLSAVFLTGGAALAELEGQLVAADFFSEAHRRLYEASCALRAEGTMIDAVTVRDRLEAEGRLAQVGGAGYISEVLDGSPSVANVAAHAAIVREAARARSLAMNLERLTGEVRGGLDVRSARERLGSLAASTLEGATATDPWTERTIVVDASWYTMPPPDRSWLLRDARTGKGALPLGKVGLLVAEGGAGKTMALMQLVLAVTTGGAWLGDLRVPKPGRVFAILGEEDAEELHRRMFFVSRSLRASAPPPGSFVALPLAGVPSEMIRRDTAGNLSDAPFLSWLRRRLAKERDLSLIVCDPLSRFAGPDAEKDNAAATRFISALESLSGETGATVIASHHSNQSSRADGSKGSQVKTLTATSSRGVTGLTDGVRWAAALGVEQLAGLDPLARPHLRELVTLSFLKSNYSHKGEPIVLRRDLENGGALVRLDAQDEEVVRAARDERHEPKAKGAPARYTADLSEI